jgi:hypothetical protein
MASVRRALAQMVHLRSIEHLPLRLQVERFTEQHWVLSHHEIA